MGKVDVEGVLVKNSWFASLPAELSESILHAGRIRHFESSLIYSGDDTADGLFALLSGQIRLMRTSATGQLIFLAIASPSTWFGLSGALDGRPHAYDAIAIGQTAVFHLSQEKTDPGHRRKYLPLRGIRLAPLPPLPRRGGIRRGAPDASADPGFGP